MQAVETVWDLLTWSYLTRWQATLPPQVDGTTVRYRISAWNAEHELFADYPDARRTVERAASAYFSKKTEPTLAATEPAGDPHGMTFAYRVDTYRAPEWAKQMVMYHLLIDRFYPGGGRGWTQTSNLRAFCGGTLWGAAEKLDHIARLGCDAIWLSPPWESPTHHGYDVADYAQIMARYGGNEALRHFIRQAHDRGIRVVLDLVCNHISNQSPIFQEALHNPSSPYRSWFSFDDSPVGYRTFFGVATMPQVNLADEGAKQWMLDTARRWIHEFGADGYRLDYAMGVAPSFWWEFRAACREANPESFIFGEIIEAPNVMRSYEGKLDGTLDFLAAQALRQVYGWKTLEPAHLAQRFASHRDYFHADFVLPTFLDNHDMDRFLYIAGGDVEALKAAAQAQFALPGPPILYYGTEVGLSQAEGVSSAIGLDASRMPMIWDDDQNRDVLDFYRALIQERRSRQG
ncbi:MAG: alpha-amylase [Chloroflexi bacterium]|nr:alpha-amylase [Chloroflexota bacterium]